MFGVDYAWHGDLKPFIAAMKAAKVTFVCRYLSHSSGKNLTLDEAKALTAAGISIVVVWETTAQRARAGRAAGAQDAKDALAEAKACGMPSGRPIYFAVDFDASRSDLPVVLSYLAGAASVLGKDRCGPYGEYDVAKAALDAGYGFAWQTYAWSGGRWSKAQLQQYSNDHTIGGVGLDYDRSEAADFGQWRIGWTPADQPTPHPDPTPTTEDDMIGDLYNGAGAVTPISWPRGRAKAIGFFADTGLAGKLVDLRVAWEKAPGKFHIEHVTLDSSKGKTVVGFGADAPQVDCVSVTREGKGGLGDDVPVAWDAS